MDRSIMPRRVLVLLLLLCLQQLAALGEIETTMELDGNLVVMEEGSCMHFSVTPPPAPPEDAEERREYFRAMAAKDRFRHEQMSSSRRREAKESSKLPEVMSASSMFELPMRSAYHIAKVGMYLVSVRFGTPALPYSLVLDTAHDLTWINCKLQRRKGKHYGRQSTTTMSVSGDGAIAAGRKKCHIYRPAKSSSWRRIRCSQSECAVLPYNMCQSPNKTESCSYLAYLKDGSETSGIYGTEKATVMVSQGRMAKLPGLILGCSLMELGGSMGAHDGILSLGNGDISFAVHAATRFGKRFSFCLLNANSSRDASSYLTFGPNPAVMGPGTMETEAIYNAAVRQAYWVRVTGVLVAGQRMDIPDDVWNEDTRKLGSGAILDTSTSVTALVPEAYDPITAALHSHMSHLPRENMAGFDYCYRWTYTGDGVDPAHNVTVPSFTVEMAGGARLEPGANGVLIPEVAPGVVCLAFRRLASGGGPVVFGNVLMQEHIWEIDHGNDKIRFRKDKCNTHHIRNSNSTGTKNVTRSSSTVMHRVN